MTCSWKDKNGKWVVERWLRKKVFSFENIKRIFIPFWNSLSRVACIPALNWSTWRWEPCQAEDKPNRRWKTAPRHCTPWHLGWTLTRWDWTRDELNGFRVLFEKSSRGIMLIKNFFLRILDTQHFVIRCKCEIFNNKNCSKKLQDA